MTHGTVAVEKALDGDKSADVVLKPGDVVSIEQISGWQDIGSSVTINGEVVKYKATAGFMILREHASKANPDSLRIAQKKVKNKVKDRKNRSDARPLAKI